MSFKKLMVLTCIGLLISSMATQAGTESGGGADVVILPDDSVVLADPWIDHGSPQPNNMPPMRALNPRILQSINLYQQVSETVINDLTTGKDSEIVVLLQTLAKRKNDLRFYGVKNASELNDFCASGGRKSYKLPDGAQVQQVACTAGNETFFVEPLFEKLSLRQQALLLVHERLTTLRDALGGRNYSAVARFTTGLNVYLNLYSEQSKKKFRPLTAPEQKNLTDFYIATEELGKRNQEITNDSFQWVAHAIGGGRVHLSSNVASSATIALNSVVPRDSEIGNGARVQGLVTNYLRPLMLNDNAVLENVTIDYRSEKRESNDLVSIGENSRVSDSTLSVYSFVTGNNVKIQKTKIHLKHLSLGNDIEFRDSVISYDEGQHNKVADGEKLIGKNLLSQTEVNFYPVGVVLKPIAITFPIADNTEFYTSKYGGESSYNYSLPNGDGLQITGEIKYLGKCDIAKRLTMFGEYYCYKYTQFTAKVSFKNFILNQDETQVLLNKDGRFVTAGFEKYLKIKADKLHYTMKNNLFEIKGFSRLYYDDLQFLATPE